MKKTILICLAVFAFAACEPQYPDIQREYRGNVDQYFICNASSHAVKVTNTFEARIFQPFDTTPQSLLLFYRPIDDTVIFIFDDHLVSSHIRDISQPAGSRFTPAIHNAVNPDEYSTIDSIPFAIAIGCSDDSAFGTYIHHIYTITDADYEAALHQ